MVPAALPRSRARNVKPPIGAKVNRRHRLGRNLVLCVPCNEGVGLPREVVMGQPLFYGGTTIGDGTGPAPTSQTNTPPAWTIAAGGSNFWRGPALDVFPGGAACTPIAFYNTRSWWDTRPTKGYSIAWLFNPANTTSGLTRMGDTDDGNPIGCYVNQAAAGKISVTDYGFDNGANISNSTFLVNDEWILLINTVRPGLATYYANLDASGNRTKFMNPWITRGTGDPTTATNPDPIKTILHAGTAISISASYNVANSRWIADGSRYQGLFGGMWMWWDDVLTLPDAQAFYSDMWGMLQ